MRRVTGGSRICRVCGQPKEVDQLLHSGVSKKTGERLIKNICKKCSNRQRENARKLNVNQGRRERRLAKNCRYYVWEKYGLTEEDVATMLENQGGVCAICHRLPNGKSLAVDHCHTTGKIRGLLCHSCNTSLGHFNDDVVILERAIQYLKSNNI
jgi:hypothetical protein